LEEKEYLEDKTYADALAFCTTDKPKGSLVFWATNNSENVTPEDSFCSYIPVLDFFIGITLDHEACATSRYICKDVVPITHKTE
jgi:hypothetical protein